MYADVAKARSRIKTRGLVKGDGIILFQHIPVITEHAVVVDAEIASIFEICPARLKDHFLRSQGLVWLVKCVVYPVSYLCYVRSRRKPVSVHILFLYFNGLPVFSCHLEIGDESSKVILF